MEGEMEEGRKGREAQRPRLLRPQKLSPWRFHI